MKLLLDENLSDRIIPKIIDLYPNSQHVKTLELIN
jgi:predicted nuclease of predicted toxin-antitoxin system